MNLSWVFHVSEDWNVSLLVELTIAHHDSLVLGDLLQDVDALLNEMFLVCVSC
jgi:hypothetical protein